MGSGGAKNAPIAALEAAGFQGGRHAPWSMGMQGESEVSALPDGAPGSAAISPVAIQARRAWSGCRGMKALTCLRAYGASAGRLVMQRPNVALVRKGSMPPPRQPQGVSNRGRHAPFGKMARTQDGLGSGRSTEHILRFTALPPSSACLYYIEHAAVPAENAPLPSCPLWAKAPPIFSRSSKAARQHFRLAPDTAIKLV